MMKRLISSVMCLFVGGALAFAGPVGQGGVYINGGSQGGGAGDMTTNTYSKGTGAANSNTVDHAIFADVAGNATGTIAFATLSGSSSNALLGSPLAAQVSTGLTAYAGLVGYSNAVKSMTLGAEGMRLIGALGGYDLHRFIVDTSSKGVARDKPVFTFFQGATTNLSVSWSAGDVYDPATGYYHINAGSTLLQDNANNFAYWSVASPNTVSWTTGQRANITNNIIPITSFSCSLGRIIHNTPAVAIGDMMLRMDDAHYQIFPSIVKDGLNFYPIGTNFNQIAQVGGIEVHNMMEDNFHDAKNFTNNDPVTGNYINNYFHTNSAWDSVRTNMLDITRYDNGTTLVSVIASNWYRGLFCSGAGTRSAAWIYPSASYTNYAECLAADDPVQPAGFDPYIPRCTAYIFQGGDTSLRQSSDYWIDRRFRIVRGGVSIGGGTSASIPSLFQVLTQGKASGGLLMDGMGDPANDDQASNKHYVDSKINNNNAGKAFVSDRSGDDGTALLASSIRPFKTIQAAINAAAIVATDLNRYIVDIAPGDYYENITMVDDVGLRGPDIEAVSIHGTVTYPPTYADVSGSEIALLTIRGSNTPVIVCNPGSDIAYMGIRSCYLTSTYDNDATNKSLITYTRGIGEDYGTSYHELFIMPTNGSGGVRSAQIFEHVTDPANQGLSRFTVFNASAHIASADTNDDIALMYTHDNTDAACINTALGTALDIDLDETAGTYTNFVKIVNHNNAQGRTLSMGTVTRLFMGYTNTVNVAFGYAVGGTTDNVAIVRGNHIRMPVGSTSNVWLGAAAGVWDRLRVYDSVYIQNYPDFPYPRIYTNAGVAGKFFINTVTENGDHLFGSAVDFSVINSTAVSLPASGHLKQYVSPYAGLENMYLKDSSGNTMRICRDNFYNGYNDDTTDMKVGDAVYITDGLSPDNTPRIKKSIASDPSTLPVVGVVAQLGGITTGKVGRVMLMGRLEQGMDTTMFTSGQKLYLSETIKGGLTNVAPTGTNVSQIIATAHIIGTNGYLSIRPWSPDLFGGLPSSSYARSTHTGNWDAAYTWVDVTSNAVTYALSRTNAWDANSDWYLANSGAVAYVSSRTSVWDNAAAVQQANTAGVAYVLSRTSAWDTAVAVQQANTAGVTYVLSRSNAWDNGAVQAAFASNGVVTLNASTGLWNTISGVSNTATFASNGVVTLNASTGLWNTISGVSNTATFASNGVVTLNASTGLWNTVSGVSNTATTAAANALYASNGVVSLNASTGLWNTISGVSNTATTAAANALYASNGVVTLNSSTGLWNTVSSVSNNATFASNGVVTLNSSTGLWNTVSSVSNNATFASNGVVTLNGSTGLWNTVSGVSNNATFASNGVVTLNGRTSLWNTVSSVSNNATFASNGVVTLNASTGNWNAAYTYVNGNSNGLNYVLSRTSTWDAVGAVMPKFKAGLQTNITVGGNTLAKVFFTNLMYTAGAGVYDATNSRWTPMSTNKLIVLAGGWDYNTYVANQIGTLLLYKNGSAYVDVAAVRSPNNAYPWTVTWTFSEISTSTNDFYEIYVNNVGGSAASTSGTYSNNWWSGHVIQ